MKSISIQVLFLVFSLLMVANMSYGRKDLGDYWKNKMNNEQPMPEAIENLIQVPKALSSNEGKEDHSFNRDFDVHPNVILYHTHVHEEQKPIDEHAVANMSYGRKDLGDYWKNKMNEQPMPEAIENLIQVSKALSSNEGKEDHSFNRDFDVHPNLILYHTHVHEKKPIDEHAVRKMESLITK